MRQDGEIRALLPQCPDSSNGDAGGVLDPTSSCDLYTVGGERWVISYRRERRNVNHRAGGTRIERKAQDNAACWAKDLGLNDDQALPGAERVAHSTTAVPSGISPV